VFPHTRVHVNNPQARSSRQAMTAKTNVDPRDTAYAWVESAFHNAMRATPAAIPGTVLGAALVLLGLYAMAVGGHQHDISIWDCLNNQPVCNAAREALPDTWTRAQLVGMAMIPVGVLVILLSGLGNVFAALPAPLLQEIVAAIGRHPDGAAALHEVETFVSTLVRHPDGRPLRFWDLHELRRRVIAKLSPPAPPGA